MKRLSKSHLNWAKGLKASIVWAEQKWRHSRNWLLEKLSCEGGWKLLNPCPACSFPSECAWSVMAAKCRENGQHSTLLELIAMFAILTEDGFWLLLFRVPCLILSLRRVDSWAFRFIYSIHHSLYHHIPPSCHLTFCSLLLLLPSCSEICLPRGNSQDLCCSAPEVYSPVWDFAHCQ